MIDWAKMIGITPAVISRSGMKVFCPSRIRPRPITLRGIWIGMRRAAIVIATTAAIDRHQDDQEQHDARARSTTPLLDELDQAADAPARAARRSRR